jgi:flagellar biosynthetic protein FliR
MRVDTHFLFGLLMVFTRCSALFLAAPVFGAQNVPVRIRILGALVISFALLPVIGPHLGNAPADLGSLILAVGTEALVGVLIGVTLSLVIQAATMAGAIVDLQMGLSISQSLNPMTGVPVTILSQFKLMLATVMVLCLDAHHSMILGLVSSYQLELRGNELIGNLPTVLPSMLGTACLAAVQMALPMLAVTLVIDAALGLMNKAVPMMQAIQLSVPAKTLMGFITLGIALPAFAAGVTQGVDQAMIGLEFLLGGR